MSESKALYYPVYIAARAPSSRGTAVCWGRPCDHPGEASRILEQVIEDGEATLGFIVRFRGGAKDILHTWTQPTAARRIIQHLLAVEDAMDNPPGGLSPMHQ